MVCNTTLDAMKRASCADHRRECVLMNLVVEGLEDFHNRSLCPSHAVDDNMAKSHSTSSSTAKEAVSLKFVMIPKCVTL